MITADFAIMPVGSETTELKEYIAVAVREIKKSNLNYQLTGMGTQIEAENLEELYKVITKAQEALFKYGASRAYSIIKIDDRRDKENRVLDAKIKSVNDILEK